MLETCPSINKFLRITRVIDANADLKTQEEQKVKCENDFKVFMQNLNKYQKAAVNDILTNSTLDDDKQIYSHVLFYYYPHLMQKNRDNRKASAGAFTLQSFEHRIKESKTQ